mmetsp:Transcript_19783/g.41301  ORF Transcript_19783/g.41301 Transcript_19783/m.41301 type:complete len:536 (+) Transcript_19783:40-1647(+)
MLRLTLIALLFRTAQSHLFESCFSSTSATPSSSGAINESFYYVRGDEKEIGAADQMTIAAYSGFLSREQASLALIGKAEDKVWLDAMLSETNRPSVDIYTLEDVLTKVPCTSGCKYVLCEIGEHSTSAALSFAAASADAVLVATQDNKDVLEKYGITLLKDLRGVDADWAVTNPDLTFNSHVSVLQQPGAPVPLADLSVRCGALTWFGDGDCKTSTLAPKALGLLESGDSIVIGWGGGDDPEWDCVHASTVQGAMGVIAADFAVNLGILMRDGTTTLPPFTQNISYPDVREPTGKHTVSFVMSDGDNVQWVLNDWSSPTGGNDWWSSEQRGQVKIGWTFNPTLATIAEPVFKTIFGGKTENDEFIAGPSGAGYSFPNDFTDTAFDAFSKETAFQMSAAGQRIVNVLADEGKIEEMGPLLEQDGIDAVFLYEYNGYSELEGKLDFVNGKPVIGGRFNLWTPGFYDVDSLVQALKDLPNLTDSSTSDGYSVIPVHAWSHNVTDVVRAAAMLEEDGRFDVVLPSELVQRLNAFVQREA